MLAGLAGERVRQAFAYYDSDNTGYILPVQFQKSLNQPSHINSLTVWLVNLDPSAMSEPQKHFLRQCQSFS